MAKWREKYAGFLSQYPHARGAEIGVLQGANAISLLINLPDLELLYCVDNWSWNHRENMIKYFENMEPYKGRIRILHMKSTDAHIHVEDGSLDFVFIDANHRYENVITDIVCWIPKIKIGGIISGHDYIHYETACAYDVKGAVNKMFPKAEIQGQIWYVIKRGDKNWKEWTSV